MTDHYLFEGGEEFYQRFRVPNRLPSFPKEINVYPGAIEPILAKEGSTFVWIMKWGLIPFWAKSREVSDKMFTIRSESVLTKLGFRQSFRSKRCLIPANGFYIGSNFFSFDHRPFLSFAGIYDIWVEPVSGHEVYTYAIITTNSNSQIKSFSDRMPVILRQSDEEIWLNPKTPVSKLEQLLCPSTETLTITND